MIGEITFHIFKNYATYLAKKNHVTLGRNTIWSLIFSLKLTLEELSFSLFWCSIQMYQLHNM